MKFLIVKEPITDVIEIEAKKEETINEKHFIDGDLLAFVNDFQTHILTIISL